MLRNLVLALALASIAGVVAGTADVLRLALFFPGSLPGSWSCVLTSLEYGLAALFVLGLPVATLRLGARIVGAGPPAGHRSGVALTLAELGAFGAGLWAAFGLGLLEKWLTLTRLPDLEGVTDRPWLLVASVGLAALLWGLVYFAGSLIGGRRPSGEDPGFSAKPRRVTVRLGALFAISLALAFLGPAFDRPPTQPPPSGGGRPHVVLIVLDTVRGDVFLEGLADPRIAPRMASLAKEGTLLTNFAATSTWTLPTHGSLFTGLMPRVHGARMPDRYLGEDLVTLAEVLETEGYRTACITNNPWVSPTFGLCRGFQRVWDPRKEVRERPVLHTLWDRYLFQVSGPRRFGSPVGDKLAAFSLRLAEGWIDAQVERFEDRPMFLFLNLMNAHLPYLPPSEYTARFFEPGEPSPESYGHRAGLLSPDQNKANRARASGLRRLYRASIAYLDDVVGEMADMLRERDLLDDTLFAVVSDHGEHLGEHGELGHGGVPWRTTTWVPLLIRHPGSFGAGQIDARLASQVDFLPTVLEVARIDPQDHGFTEPLPGRSLLAEPDEDSLVISEFHGNATTARLAPSGSRDAICVFDDQHRLMWTDQGGYELLEVTSEGDLERPIEHPDPDVLSRLQSYLERWVDTVKLRESTGGPEISEAERRRLQAIGYEVEPPDETRSGDAGD